ncbi:DNA gyrase subunit A [Patescibacteria group bacterium]|nr:DNA gyrase subunit A [Patescibacteria group bacterium]
MDEKDKKFLTGDIGEVRARDINEEMQESYLDYAMSVIVARALPDVRDGLKPVHRRILFAMDNIGLRPSAKYRKSATVVGEVLGKYHPHGDSAVYETMVRMAQDFSMRYTLVDGQGNFGSIDGDSAAAMRYTEAKMDKISEEILSDIDKDTVDFVPNYDGTQKEPVVLPTRVPALLLNGTEGIAVGMATKVPPHNLSEVVDGVVHLIENPDATVEDLMKHVKGPDFPTGGVIFDNGEIKMAYGTGRGGVLMRAVAEIEESKKDKFRIIITEIPYQVNKATLITKISELVKTKKIVGISDIRDESDRNQAVRIVIELKKDAYANKILNQLYKLTPMQCSYHMNMIALVNQINPQLLTLKMILEEFIKHREDVVKRRTQYELKKAKERSHILEGLLIALNRIDEVIATIKQSKDQEDAKNNLIKKFKLSEVQSLAILAMPLRTLAGLERKKIQDEYDELQKKIKYLESLLASRTKMLDLIKKELQELKDKYGDPRRTKIIKKAVGKFEEEDLIPNEQVVITLTESNYVKRVLSSSYKTQGRGGKGVLGMSTKDEDVVEMMAEAESHDNLLFFTNEGRVFQVKAYEIPQASRTAKGNPIVNLLQLAPEEVVTSFVVISDMNEDTYLVMATDQGTIKKTATKAFANIRKSGIIAIGLSKGEQLIWVRVTNGTEEIMMVTEDSQAIRFNEKEIRPMGRSARGVRGMRLRKGDRVIGMDSASPKDEVVVIMENGYGKRTDVRNFASHHRGGMGVKAGKVTPKTGKTVGIQIVESGEDDLVVISNKGTIIRTPIKNISKMGRATQGVRIMKIGEGDKVASVASIPKMKNDGQLAMDLEGNVNTGNNKETKNSKASKSTKKVTLKDSKKTVNSKPKKVAPKKTAKKSVPKKATTNAGFRVKKVTESKSKKSASGFKIKKIDK